MGVFTQKYPLEAPALMKYSEIVRELAARGYNWHYYDENFRYLRQKEPISFPWGSIHWELWIKAQPSGNGYNQIKRNANEVHVKSKVNVPKGIVGNITKALIVVVAILNTLVLCATRIT